MTLERRPVRFATFIFLGVGLLGGCDRGDAPAGGAAATKPAAAGGAVAPAAARDACPTEAEIAAVIASPVKRLKGAGCAYQSEDQKTNVSILISGAASGEQLLKEMTESNAPGADAKVEPVEGVGERAHVKARPGQATAVAVGGGKAYWVEISSVGGSSIDRKPQVIQVMKMLMR